MPISALEHVRFPPALLIDRFLDPMLRVIRTWQTVGQFVPVVITSWWDDGSVRSKASQHHVGTAIDGLSPALTRAQLLPLVAAVGRYYGVSVPTAASSTSGRSVHVQGLPFGVVANILRNEPNLLVRAASEFHGPPRPTGV